MILSRAYLRDVWRDLDETWTQARYHALVVFLYEGRPTPLVGGATPTWTFYLFLFIFSIFFSQFHFPEAVHNVHKYNI